MKDRKAKAKPKKKVERPFFAPFTGLEDLAKEMKKATPIPCPLSPEVGKGDQSVRPGMREMSDEEMFAAEVADVAPIDPAPLPTLKPPPLRAPASEDDEVRAHLDALVAGEAPFHFSDSDEYIEGWVRDLDHRILKKLRRGEFSVEEHLDLHRLVKEEAKPLVRAFVWECRKKGLRCVRIVHGRGLHSKDTTPVLKEALKVWLSQGGIGAQVLAFTSAPPADGGAGAVYVLLRK